MHDSASLPIRDPARLAALRRTGLLDALPDESFDRLTRLASQFLGTPVALVSLVSENQQVFKSVVGLGEPWASRREIPLEYSYCKHALGSTEPLVIEDARTHPLTHDSPAVTENTALAYAGVPITSEGQVLGTLCVVDTRPRQWSEAQIQTLRDLAAGAQTEVDLRRAERQAREGQAYLGAIVEAQQSIAEVGLDLSAVLSEIVQRACRLTEAEAAVVELAEGDEMVCRASCGSAEDTQVGLPLKMVSPLGEEDVRAGQVLQSADTENDDRLDRDTCRRLGARSLVIVPMLGPARRPGRLTVYSTRPGAFSEPEVQTLKLLASLVSSALHDAQRFARERELVQQLRESEALYRSVIEGAAEGFFLLVREGDDAFRYQMMNPALARIMALAPGDFVGRTPEQVLPPEAAARVRGLCHQVYDTGAPTEVLHTVHLPRGEATVRTRFYPIFDDGGTVVRILGATEDVTKQVRIRKHVEQIAAEAQLNLSRLEAVLRALPVGVFITDASGVVQMTNPAALYIWGGHTPLVGVESYGEYRAWRTDTGAPLTPDDWPIARAIRTGQPVLDEELEIEGFDGVRRTILASGLRIHDESEHVVGGIAVNSDITVRKQAEAALRESRGRFHTAFENAPIGMALVGLDGRWLEVNDALCQITGYGEEELLLKRFQDITHPEDLEVDLDYAQQLLRGEISSYQMQKRYLHRDGHAVWVQLTGSLMHGAAGEPLYFVAQIQDIGERLRAEQMRQEYARELERSNRELQDFAYVASHDLQEPLRKIQAFGDRLHERHRDALGEQGADYLTRMQSAARRMQILIQDLLAYSRVSSRAQPFVSVDLGEIAQEVITDLQARIEATGARVDVEDLPRLQADPMQIRQLLQNLIGNALKFHREGVPPRVRIASEPTDGKAFRIRVEDNGIGFEPQYAERIFTLFERLHGRSEYEGTGMGLAICRKIAERHGGSITAESTPGEGTTFIVTLPAEQPDGER